MLRRSVSFAPAVSRKSVAQQQGIYVKPVYRQPLLAPQLQEDKGKYTIVLDMDETLLHSAEVPPFTADLNLEVLHVPVNAKFSIYSILRPFASELIKELGSCSELVLWTAGEAQYARAVMKHVDPAGLIRHSIYRDPSWFSMSWYVKDLTRLGRDMDHTIIVDNSDFICRENVHNAIVIDDFLGDKKDNLLVRLHKVLNGLISSRMTVPAYLDHCNATGELRFHRKFFRILGDFPSKL